MVWDYQEVSGGTGCFLPPYILFLQCLFPNHLKIKRIKEGGEGGGGFSVNALSRDLASLSSSPHSRKTLFLGSSYIQKFWITD